jgi:hypothetical protein
MIWHAACFALEREFFATLEDPGMQSQVIALLVPVGCRRAALLVRRGDGQFALEGIDARVASATRVAATWFRQGSPIVDPTTSAVVGYEVSEESAA